MVAADNVKPLLIIAGHLDDATGVVLPVPDHVLGVVPRVARLLGTK